MYATKKACEQARKDLMGRCVAMTQDKKVPTVCDNWATSSVDDRNYCGMHAGGVLSQKLDLARAEKALAELDTRLNEYLHWALTHPSVWDTRLHV